MGRTRPGPLMMRPRPLQLRLRLRPLLLPLLLLALQTLAPAAASGTVADAPPGPEVVISEVHPWPDGDAAAEFVELHVPASEGGVASLRGWTLTDGDGAPELVLGRVTLEPGAHLVVWNCPRPAGARGLACNRRSPTWNNDGDDVVLLDAQGRVRARLAYGTGDAVDPPPEGWTGAGAVGAPRRGMSVSLDPLTGTYVEAPPTPGRAGPPAHSWSGPSTQAPSTQAPSTQAPPTPGPEAGKEGPRPPSGGSRCAEGSPTPAQLLLVGVHPGGGPDWEVVVLENLADAPAPLGGCSLSDGEGLLLLPEGASVPGRARAHVATNTSAHEVLFGRPPDVIAIAEGPFGLADTGDGLRLLAPDGCVMDSVLYGECGAPIDGWTGAPVACPARMPWGRLLVRGSGPDTNTSADWTGLDGPSCGSLEPWTPGAGWEGNVACFVTPEEGLSALAGAVASARERIAGAVYRLTSPELVASLAARTRAGVRVELVVEGRPVGATDDEMARRDGLLAALAAEGAVVRMTFTTVPGERAQPYLYHHAKYLVVDGRLSVVTTENWVASSFPPGGDAHGRGTRGWGAVVECARLAAELEAVHAHDVARCTLPWDGANVTPTPLPAVPAGRTPTTWSGAVTLLVGPEGLGEGLSGLLDVLGRAGSTLDVELADLEVMWDGAPSPLVGALLDAAARGVGVRVLVEPGMDGAGEREVCRLLALASAAGASSLRATVFRGVDNVSRLHAKGAIVDGREVLLGSINWVRAALLRNREVDVALACPAAVARLCLAFEADWCASVAASPPGPPLPVIVALLDGWTPRPGPLPPPPPGRHPVGGTEPDYAPVVRAALFVGGGLGLWALERRYRPLARLRAALRTSLLNSLRNSLNAALRGAVAPAVARLRGFMVPGAGPGEGPPPTQPPHRAGPGPPQGWSWEDGS